MSWQLAFLIMLHSSPKLCFGYALHMHSCKLRCSRIIAPLCDPEVHVARPDQAYRLLCYDVVFTQRPSA